jgi:hypothetical protein
LLVLPAMVRGRSSRRSANATFSKTVRCGKSA